MTEAKISGDEIAGIAVDHSSPIAFNRACFEGRESANLSEAISNGHVSGNGPFTKRAEAMIESITGVGRTLLTTSCTHALEMAARLLDLQTGDEVIVPSYTFVSTASAFMMHGATPVFVDVDPRTLNLVPELVEKAITNRTRAICIVHYAGVGASPDTFRQIADKHGLILIEDNAHGLFGSWKGQPLGSFGHMSTLSFHETKNMTCGEGGALHINDERFVERAEILREKGTDRSKFLRGQVDKYTWVDVGSSWVISDLLAAILVAQLERSTEIQSKRLQIWNHYHDAFSSAPLDFQVHLPHVPVEAKHPAHMYFLQLESLDARTRFIEHLKLRNVNAVFHYQPLHLSAVGLRLGGYAGQCPITEAAAECLVRLPLHLAMTPSDVGTVTNAVAAFAYPGHR